MEQKKKKRVKTEIDILLETIVKNKRTAMGILKRKTLDNQKKKELEDFINLLNAKKEKIMLNKQKDKIDNLCYKKCNSGYTAEGTNCRKGFDSILNEKISNNKPILEKYNWYIVAFLFLFFLYVFLKK